MKLISQILILLCVSSSAVFAQRIITEYSSPTTASISRLEIVSPTTFWLRSGDKIYGSKTAGDNWEEFNPGMGGDFCANSDFCGLHFYAEDSGWLWRAYFDTTYVLRTAHTINGGLTWTEHELRLKFQPGTFDYDAEKIISDPFFLDDRHGWVEIMSYYGDAWGTTNFFVAYTANGGENWSPVTGLGGTHHGPDTLPAGWGILHPNFGWKLLYHEQSGFYLYAPFDHLILSLDHRIYRSIRSGELHFFDETTAIVPTYDWHLFSTTDAGATWDTTVVQSSAGEIPVKWQFLNQKNGWAVVPGDESQIYFSANMGKTWFLQLTIPARVTTFDIYDANAIWFGCADGRIFQYNGYVRIEEDDTDKSPNQQQNFLLQNSPNPFSFSTTISYQLSYADHIQICVYNLAGQKVRTLVDQQASAGASSVIWDGRNDQGQPVSSGVYLYRLETSFARRQNKLLLVR